MEDLDSSIAIGNGFLVLVLLLLLGTFLYQLDNDETIPIADDEVLMCHIKNIKGYTDIDKSKIVEYDPDTGYWIFANGYAKNCYIKKNK